MNILMYSDILSATCCDVIIVTLQKFALINQCKPFPL